MEGPDTRSGEDGGYAPLVYRSGFSYWSGWAGIALGALLAVDVLVRGEGTTRWVGVLVVAVVAVVVHAVSIRPRLLVDRDGVVVVNPLQSVRVPWAAVTGVRGRYSLELLTEGRTVSAWAVPVSARQRHVRRLRTVRAQAALDPLGRRPVEPVPLGRSRGDEVVEAVSQRWADYRQHVEWGDAPAGATGPVRVEWARTVIGLLVTALLLLLVAVVLG